MKKKLMISGLFGLTITAFILIYLVGFGENNLGAQARSQQELSRKMMDELRKEQKLLTEERARLQQYEQNLKNFAAELDKRHNEFLLQEKNLKADEEAFNKKLESKTVDRQTIETYESIDPEQAAILMKNLYVKDRNLATLVMRKIAGKKAGKILEAMIPLDREVSTQLAKETLDFYKPK